MPVKQEKAGKNLAQTLDNFGFTTRNEKQSMDQLTTQCPNCGTSFRVTQEQLQIANGSVRCGSCMHIFQAASHQSRNENRNTRQAEDPALNFSYNDLDENNESNPAEKSGEFSESFLELDKWQDDEIPAFQEADASLTEGQASDEQWARDLLDNMDGEPAATPDQTASASTSSEHKSAIQRQTSAGGFSALDGDRELADKLDFSNDITGEDNKEFDGDAGRSSSFTEQAYDPKDQLINRIEASPVELHLDTSSRWLENSFWGLSILSALTLLLAQTLYFNFNTLAVDPQYRPWYAQICEQLDCQLPKLSDITLVKASNLMVRSHPHHKNALIVDAIVTNGANYEQAFPLLELVFTDLQGNIVAGRVFHANEYLSGELKGSTNIPRQRPIHLSLELLDPGPTASSYSLLLHKNKTS